MSIRDTSITLYHYTPEQWLAAIKDMPVPGHWLDHENEPFEVRVSTIDHEDYIADIDRPYGEYCVTFIAHGESDHDIQLGMDIYPHELHPNAPDGPARVFSYDTVRLSVDISAYHEIRDILSDIISGLGLSISYATVFNGRFSITIPLVTLYGEIANEIYHGNMPVQYYIEEDE